MHARAPPDVSMPCKGEEGDKLKAHEQCMPHRLSVALPPLPMITRTRNLHHSKQGGERGEPGESPHMREADVTPERCGGGEQKESTDKADT